MKFNLDRSIWVLGLLTLSVVALGVDRVMQSIKVDQIQGASGTTVTIPAGNVLKVDSVQGATAGVTPPGMVPIGGIVAVMPNTAGAWQPPASGQCKDGFTRADGAAFSTHPTCAGVVITASPYMVGGKYLRGNTTSGTTGGANTEASNVTVGIHTALSLNGESSHTHGSGSIQALLTFTGPYVYAQQSPGAYTPTVGGTLGMSSNSTAMSYATNTGGSTAAGSSHAHSFSQNITAHSVTNNTVNNEPSYIEVVYVIRVK
jgi:hypothetical protein